MPQMGKIASLFKHIFIVWCLRFCLFRLIREPQLNQEKLL